MAITSGQLVHACNVSFLNQWNTRLVGGFSEPLYLPGSDGIPAEIQFTKDFVRSALHELAHWCIAGAERRKLVDYGYWYSPDGRNKDEQMAFFRMEVKPQALELAFSRKCKIHFEVSCDNLGGVTISHDEFETKVHRQLLHYETHGFPARAREVLALLDGFFTENLY